MTHNSVRGLNLAVMQRCFLLVVVLGLLASVLVVGPTARVVGGAMLEGEEGQDDYATLRLKAEGLVAENRIEPEITHCIERLRTHFGRVIPET